MAGILPDRPPACASKPLLSPGSQPAIVFVARCSQDGCATRQPTNGRAYKAARMAALQGSQDGCATTRHRCCPCTDVMDSDDGSVLGPAICELQNPRSLPFSPGRSRGRLAHLIKPGCTYFVTFCLQQSRSAHARNQRRPKSASEPEDIARLSEPPLAAVAPLLGLPRIARVVESALLHFQGQRYGLHAWCVMPDHVHTLVTPVQGHQLDEILHSWKSFTANEANRMLHRAGVFGSGSPSTILSAVRRHSRDSRRTSKPIRWPLACARTRRHGRSAARVIARALWSVVARASL